ncbi:MAG: TiaS agmantine-binding domain-containing protein [Candidatus Kariarchaeaceae archaeon]
MSNFVKVTLGIDDTDSPLGNCTTHLVFLLLSILKEKGWKPIDFPRLIRNNPNVPFKTRGNGSAALTFLVSSSLNFEKIHNEISSWLFSRTSDHEMTNPGFILMIDEIGSELTSFAQQALVKVLTIDETISILDRSSAYYSFKGTGQGLIGSLAAIGNELKNDYTYELLTYRIATNRGTKRKIERESFVKLDDSSFQTFSSYDRDTGRVTSVPNGPDPVLYGIRGESADLLIAANTTIKQLEKIEGWCIFRTNQGTDEHLANAFSSLNPYEVSLIEAKVVNEPKVITGGHTILSLERLSDHSLFHALAYEPSKSFRTTIKELRPEDRLIVGGSIRGVSPSELPTFNIERLDVVEVASFSKLRNPPCPSCNKRMESDGVNAGYKCKKCKIKDPSATKVPIFESRSLKKGRYLPPIGAHRHLTMPFSRYGLAKKNTSSSAPSWSDFLSVEFSQENEESEELLD